MSIYQRSRLRRHRLRFLSLLVIAISQAAAFSIPQCMHSHSQHTKRTCLNAGFGKDSNSKPTKPAKAPKTKTTELFELQELRAQLSTILKDNYLYQTLSDEKREEISKYIKAVIEKTDSPIDVSGKKNGMGTVQFVAGIENKSWRMVFSTESSAVDGSTELPYGSTVVLRIGEFEGNEGVLDYVLKFSKQVMGLRELVAKSTCEVELGPPSPGLLTFQYEDIKTNIFGMSNLPVGFFGLLKGRVAYIDTVWFDGERWIERTYDESGNVWYNVYLRDVEDERLSGK